MFHLRGRCAKTMCGLWQGNNDTSVSVPAAQPEMDFVCWGYFLVNQGQPLGIHRLVLFMQRNYPFCLEPGPLEGAGFYFLGTKLSMLLPSLSASST